MLGSPVYRAVLGLLLALVSVFGLQRPHAQATSSDAVQAEVERCERRIREVRVEIGNRYEKRLVELRTAFQKAADLESALLVRNEERRLGAEVDLPLDSRHLLEEPRLLREAQLELLAKQTEMVTQIVQDVLPRLVEMKKALTVGGKLDEALEVRNSIQRLQDAGAPAQRLAGGAQVTADEVSMAYQSAKERADKIYKGVKVSLRGRVAGVRPDAKDPSSNVLVLFGGSDGSLVDCAFQSNEYRVREERSAQNVFYVVAHLNGDVPALRVQRGVVIEIQGRCEGFEGGLRFANCSLPKR